VPEREIIIYINLYSEHPTFGIFFSWKKKKLFWTFGLVQVGSTSFLICQAYISAPTLDILTGFPQSLQRKVFILSHNCFLLHPLESIIH
jgi:hypothetical protein